MAQLMLDVFEPPKLPRNHTIVQDADTFQTMLTELQAQKEVAYDFETSGTAYWAHARPVSIGLGYMTDDGPKCWYVPWGHGTTEKQLDEKLILGDLGKLLCDPTRATVAHHHKFEDHMGRVLGWKVEGPRHDTMVAAHLYDENQRVKLEIRAEKDLGIKGASDNAKKITEIVKKLAHHERMKIKAYKNQYGYSMIPVAIAGPYGCTDVDHCLRLRKFYKDWGVETFFPRIYQTEMELTRICCDMEHDGVPVNKQYLLDANTQLNAHMGPLSERIFDAFGGHRFNLKSDEELADAIEGRLKIKLTERTKEGHRKVDQEVLGPLVERSDAIKYLMEWKDCDKINNSFTLSLVEKLDAKHHLHCDFRQIGTTTGRLSCAKPNLQQMPNDKKDKPHIPSIRSAFLVPEGHVRLYFDYSQIELRVLAKESGDPKMIQAYINGDDIHEATAQGAGVTRRKAKVINFGLCLTGHQEVLTNEGLIRLDEVKASHLLWDGIEWVTHDGLICRGEQEVVTYDGVEATPDHVVYTEDGRKIPIGCLASELHPGRIARGADGRSPISYDAHSDRQSEAAWEDHRCGSCVWCLREGSLHKHGRDQIGSSELHLSEGEVQGPPGSVTGAAVRRYGSALRAGYARFLNSLQGTWDQGALRVAGTLHSMGFGDVSNLGLQGFGLRPQGQRGPLLAGESAPRATLSQSEESAQARWRLLQGRTFASGGQSLHQAQDGTASLPGVHEDLRQSISRPATRRAKVYDLLNAGPRHRFTVAGKIVSNSYGMGPGGYAKKVGVTIEEARRDFDAFFRNFVGIQPYKRALARQAAEREDGQLVNLFGRARRVPMIHAKEKWKKGSAERQITSSRIQGTAAELTKESMVRIDHWIRDRGCPAKMVLTVHDEIQVDVPIPHMIETARAMKSLMSDFPEFAPVPIVADGEYSVTNWADKKALPGM